MPILNSALVTVIDQNAFHSVDRIVTGFAFDIQNDYGRYLDEQLYQTELAARLTSHGLNVTREMKMTLQFESFSKDYFADFLLNGSVIAETKTVQTLTSAHTAQVLNYLYMCGLHPGTLLNLRSEKVQHEFVSTSLTHEERRKILWDTANWKPLTARCEILRSTIALALDDWGARLDPLAYRDAAIYFLGGEWNVVKEVDVQSKHGILGRQKICLLSEDVAFSITASRLGADTVLQHQRRFLQHTHLHALQWVNLHGQTASLYTIIRS